MVTLSNLFATILFASVSVNACYQTCTSSTKGKFSLVHSEPKDHGGAAQYANFNYNGCSGSYQVFDGCRVTLSNLSGCGSVSCRACPGEKKC